MAHLRSIGINCKSFTILSACSSAEVRVLLQLSINLFINSEGNGKYAGAYKLDDDTGEVSGCPARSLSVKDVMKAIKNKANKKGASATRNHAEAMTLDDLTQMMKWSVSQCPDERFGSEYTPETTSDLVLMLEHSTFRAFASLAFVIWTR